MGSMSTWRHGHGTRAVDRVSVYCVLETARMNMNLRKLILIEMATKFTRSSPIR
jgi:hypothetical protein